MEQQPQQSQTTASPDPVSTREGFARCRSRKRSGGRCRLPVQDPATGLCFRHTHRVRKTTDRLDDSLDLSAELFTEQSVLSTAEDINSVLCNVVTLVAQGRISTRRAAVITYTLSHVLRSVAIMDREPSQPPQIISAPPRPFRDDVEPASPQPSAAPNRDAHPQTSHDAAENYARLRT